PPPQIPPYHAAPDVSSNNIPQQAQTPMGSSMPPTMPPMSMGQYTPAYSPSVSQMSVGSQMSYQLQSTPRSKQQQPHREIKRRTRTGCLTCRKRRIKVSLLFSFFVETRDGCGSSTRCGCSIVY